MVAGGFGGAYNSESETFDHLANIEIWDLNGRDGWLEGLRCVCVCVCMYVCMNECVYVCGLVGRTKVCMCVCVHVCIYE